MALPNYAIFFKKKLIPYPTWWNHGEGELYLGQAAPGHRGGGLWLCLEEMQAPKAMPRWHVFPCMGRPILVQGTQAAVLLDRWRIRRWKLVCFTFHGSLSFRGNKNGKAIASIINCAGIAVTEMCFPQCFLSVGCKFCIVDVLIKSNKNLFFHILTFLLYVNIMDF